MTVKSCGNATIQGVISAIMIICWGRAFSQQTLQFTPTTYSHVFSAQPAPVLRIKLRDTIHTRSVDAGGLDHTGTRVTERGNPLTGPFYVEGAEPGDILAVTLTTISLNRNFATTLNTLVPKMLPKSTAMKTWRSAKLLRWKLDLENMVGSPMDTSLHLQNLSVPLHPFLGCVGVAPEGTKQISSGASGEYGGNLDFSFITSGATVYLPVYHSGGLLYLGDGHAVQGDGELNGDALETSMNFSFTVHAVKKVDFPLELPMVETADYLMFFAIESSLDKSAKTATMALNNWLQNKYKLSAKQASQVIGPAIQYKIPKIAGGVSEVVALIPKKILQQLEIQ
jgi:amidase